MKKWSSIEQFRHVVKYIRDQVEYNQVEPPTLLFRGTVKLHGTNAGIRRQNGEFTAQGRSRELTLEDDNYGFAKWLHDNLKDDTFKNEINQMFDRVATQHDPSTPITIYGEWCGKGIQKKVAVSELDKRFVIFGAAIGDQYQPISQSINMPSFDSVDNILDAGVFLVSVDFNEPGKSLPEFERLTLDVENCCPYARKYGVEGIGEGIVWTCLDNPANSNLWFKTKGEKHSGKSNKERKVATVDPEKQEKISDLVDYVLTPSRLQQGLEHVDEIDMKCMGQYLKWIGLDVKKEESDTIEASGLQWAEISKHINATARVFFTEQVNNTL